MALDGITMRALTKELKEKLVSGRIQKIYQINPHLVLFNIYNKENYKLLVSTNPQNARIHLTKSKYETPKQATQFTMIMRKHLQNASILSIEQNGLDRTIIIKVSGKNELGILEEKKVFVDIMGKHSNLVLTDENNKVLESIKRISHEMSSLRAVYPGTKFNLLEDNKHNILDGLVNLEDLDIDKNFNVKKIFYMTFTGFGPQIGQEIAFRSNIDPARSYASLSDKEKEDLNDNFLSISKQIIDQDFCYYLYDYDNSNIDYYPIKLEHKADNFKILDSISEALDVYSSNKVDDNSLNQAKANLINILDNQLGKDIKKLHILEEEYKDSLSHDDYRIKGDLLSMVAHTIKKGKKSIVATNYENNKEVNIDLDISKSPWENIEHYYKISKKLSKRKKILESTIPHLKEDISYIKSLTTQVNHADDLSDIDDIKDEMSSQGLIKSKNKKKKKKSTSNKHPYLRFKTDNNNLIYVGKNNKQNEEITLRIANQDDVFFHIKDLPGSHVILRKGQEFEDYEFEIAAYLAAYYSKNSNDKYIDVDYTEKKNVNKAKGAKPGMVYYTNFTTVRVDLDNEPEGYHKINED